MGSNEYLDERKTFLRKVLHRQAERHNRASAFAGLLLCFGDQLLFQIVRVRRHLTVGNLLIGCAVIAQFADSQAALGA